MDLKDILFKTEIEIEIMHERGYLRCYDTGNLKYEYMK